MAKDTKPNLRNMVIYEIYVRDHGKNGTFKDIEDDLERIKELGVDYIWFMPIHPIGKINRKGHSGCPYSISDYEKVNPEYGTKKDFKKLVEKAHHLGLKVMIDVVFNHVAADSKLAAEHPDWIYKNEDGKLASTVPEWTDVVDLVYPNKELEDYLIRVLKSWVRNGIDGFRCDVASLVPVEFWLRARKSIQKINPDFIWLAESVHINFIEARRLSGLRAHSDGELSEAFDVTYDYDIFPLFQAAIMEKIKIKRYLEMLRFQSAALAENAFKLRFVENHDQPRIMSLAGNKPKALAWTAFQAFLPGPFLIYGGQESGVKEKPDLFDAHIIAWADYELSPWMKKMISIKKNQILKTGKFLILTDEPCILAVWQGETESLLGVFNVLRKSGEISLPVKDGLYDDLMSGIKIEVKKGKLIAPEDLLILRCNPINNLSPMNSKMIDFKA